MKVRRGDAQDLPRRSPGAREHPRHRRALRPGDPHGKFHLPEFPLPAGYDNLQDYFKKVAREGLEERLVELRRRRGQGVVRHEDEAYRQRLEYEIQVIERMGFPGYFLVVWDFIRHARENDIPVGPGRARAAGSVVAYALRITQHRSAGIRPAVRALPQPRPHQHARYRHRFLHAPPGRGHPLCGREVWPRPRGPDHHLRDAGRQGRDPRRRARGDGSPLRQGGPPRQDDSGHDQVAGRGRQGRTAGLRDRQGPGDPADRRGGLAAGGAHPPRLRARGGRRDHPEPSRRARAALQGDQGATKSRS